jgi:Helix-turn-helix domain
MAYRYGAQFVMDWRPHSRVLDRNERARILVLAEALERRSKLPGRRNGLLGYVGLAVLRCLMFGFLSARTGLCCPSYEAIMVKTGLCKSSVATGLARLERTGIVRIVRRLVRQRVARVSPITGLPEAYTGTTQTSSLYSLHPPGAWASHLAVPPARPTPFPCRRQLDLLQRMALRWTTRLDLSKQGLRGGEERLPGARQIASIVVEALE